jgi:hypothetical protein
MNGRAKNKLKPSEFIPNITVPTGTETEKVKIIYLTRDKFTIVDASKYDYLMQWWWYAQPSGKNFYAMRAGVVDGKKIQIRMHRVILGLEYNDGVIIDHKNGNGLDNRIENLQIATHCINARNTRKRKDNKSGYRGVYLYKSKNWNAVRWKAQININNKRLALGYFKDPISAAIAYDNAVLKYWGREFPLNFPERGF